MLVQNYEDEENRRRGIEMLRQAVQIAGEQEEVEDAAYIRDVLDQFWRK
jgi:protein-arginine kinase activator protein McsA